jgi:protein-S-isoprenylcysteine O-methyltransferase Ste14
MEALVWTLDLVFVAVAFGLRTFLQWRRTGDSGWRLGKPHSPSEAGARALLFLSAGLLLLAALLDSARPSPLGIALALAGILLVSVAQLEMGDSWRIGVDPAERTALVDHGVYAAIRNPIYTGMVLFVAGQLLVTPGGWTLAALAAVWLGVEIQVRAVEEPYLRVTHGDAYLRWAARAGRFVPFLGRSG